MKNVNYQLIKSNSFIINKFQEVTMNNLTCLFAALLTLIWVQLVHAQTKVGVIGGLNHAHFSGPTKFNSRYLSGFGFILEKSLNDHFSIVAEPLYLQKGGILPADNGRPEMKIKGSFIEIPIFLKFSMPGSKEFNPYLIAGPYAGVKLSMEMDAEIADVAFSADLDPVTKTFDFGLEIGGGFELTLKSLSIFVEGRYSFGLVDLHKNGTFQFSGGGITSDETLDDSNEYKPRGFQLMIGAKIPIGK
jgi:hypothetical protein